MADIQAPVAPAKGIAYDVQETVYPYVNVKQNFFNPLLTNFRRTIADVNPFAYPQVPTQDRMAFGLRYGNQFYVPDVYPNKIHFTKMFPTHYDPLNDVTRPEAKFQIQSYAPGPYSHIAVTAEKLPRACIRTIQFYKRCTMINGEANCGEEANNIIEICPNWALDDMKEKAKFFTKVEAIQNHQYRKAMEISPYNEGRSVFEVAAKTWVHGTRQYLRPDTMWADERYSKITQQEINEAKKRVEERDAQKKKEHGSHKHDHVHHEHDYNQVTYKQPRPLYPQKTPKKPDKVQVRTRKLERQKRLQYSF